MKEIAIVSKNKSLARLIELEAGVCDAQAKTFSAPPRDISLFSTVFVDIDSVELKDMELYDNVVLLSTAYDESDMRRLCSPPSLSRLHALILDSEARRIVIPFVSADDKSREIFLDGSNSVAVVDGERYALSDYEMRILRILCERAGEAVSRGELNSLLGAQDGNISDVYVCRLRRKLEMGGERKVIYTVRGKGYMTKYRIIENSIS